jgi:hypothetical protein
MLPLGNKSVYRMTTSTQKQVSKLSIVVNFPHRSLLVSKYLIPSSKAVMRMVDS